MAVECIEPVEGIEPIPSTTTLDIEGNDLQCQVGEYSPGLEMVIL